MFLFNLRRLQRKFIAVRMKVPPIVHFHALDKEGNATTEPQVFREIGRRIKRKGGETSLIQRSISTGRGAGYAAKSDLKGITEKSVFSVVDLTHYRREVI